MNPTLKLAIFSLILGVAVEGFTVQSKQAFYSNAQPQVGLECGTTGFPPKTRVQFYGNGKMIFDSTKSQTFPYVKSKVSPRSIVLNSANGAAGWKNVYCMVNATRSTNTRTVPYVSGPNFRYSSAVFLPRQNYTFTCDGFIAPKPDASLTAEFSFNGKAFASVNSSGQFSTQSTVSGLRVFPVVNGNNSIVVQPTVSSNNGTYSCALKFRLTNSSLTNVASNKWKTN